MLKFLFSETPRFVICINQRETQYQLFHQNTSFKKFAIFVKVDS